MTDDNASIEVEMGTSKEIGRLQMLSDAQAEAIVRDAQYVNDLRSQLAAARATITALSPDKEKLIRELRNKITSLWKDAGPINYVPRNHFYNDAVADVLKVLDELALRAENTKREGASPPLRADIEEDI